jgi:hypothetical protein
VPELPITPPVILTAAKMALIKTPTSGERAALFPSSIKQYVIYIYTQ